jgi:ubiquitin
MDRPFILAKRCKQVLLRTNGQKQYLSVCPLMASRGSELCLRCLEAMRGEKVDQRGRKRRETA